jgi:hypothetical protein
MKPVTIQLDERLYVQAVSIAAANSDALERAIQRIVNAALFRQTADTYRDYLRGKAETAGIVSEEQLFEEIS